MGSFSSRTVAHVVVERLPFVLGSLRFRDVLELRARRRPLAQLALVLPPLPQLAHRAVDGLLQTLLVAGGPLEGPPSRCSRTPAPAARPARARAARSRLPSRPG